MTENRHPGMAETSVPATKPGIQIRFSRKTTPFQHPTSNIQHPTSNIRFVPLFLCLPKEKAEPGKRKGKEAAAVYGLSGRAVLFCFYEPPGRSSGSVKLLDDTVSTFNIQHSTFNIQHSTFNIQHSTFNIQHSTFNIQHSTFNIRFVPLLFSLVRKKKPNREEKSTNGCRSLRVFRSCAFVLFL